MCNEQDANTGNLELEPNVSMNWATDAGNPRNWSWRAIFYSEDDTEGNFVGAVKEIGGTSDDCRSYR